ncbi:MAG: pirin family protein [Planctomycetes bacterium]|nr:pirin family protein [Planctomycetota bacterium]
MITLRKAHERGHFDFGWLDTSHTFSFGEYVDPAHMGFRALRVINDDLIAPAQGFGTHGHRDMEILSWIAEGSLEHKDSLGNGSVIRPGDLQRMSAGTGVRHSEFNPSPTERTRLIQVWILPERSGLAPGYEQRHFPPADRANRLRLVAGDGRDGSVKLHQDVELWTALLEPGRSVAHDFRPRRHGWLQVVRGELDLGGRTLSTGDGVALSEEPSLAVRAETPAEILLFDLA